MGFFVLLGCFFMTLYVTYLECYTLYMINRGRETKTGEDGSYTAENLTIGYYTVQIVDEREVDETEKYPDGSMTVRILGGYTLEHQNGIVEKNVEGEPLQIVLIWTDTDRELRTGVSVYTKDAEYITSFGFDNYSLIIDQDKQYNIMDNSLDIEVGKRYSFRIYGDFHWIDDYDEFSNYGAYVIIIYNGKKITLEAPAICGNVWNIIEIDGRTKEIKIINTVDAICNM